MKILLIRRENIGDLILTTPLIAALAKHTTHKIDILVNTYNSAVLDNNPYTGKIHLYTKLHHKLKGQSTLAIILKRIKTLLAIRCAKYDVIIVADIRWSRRALQWAKFAGAKRIIAIGEDAPACVTDRVIPLKKKQHIVELLIQLASPLGIHAIPGPLELFVLPQEKEHIAARFKIPGNKPVYGLQISARQPQQRWTVEKFIALAHCLSQREDCHFLLLWSPGTTENTHHPGDDDKAQHIINGCRDLKLTAIRTDTLRELMAAMSLCDYILTSDGGAMHIAAGVKKPIVALFGNHDAWFWGPWQVPCEIIEAETQDVSDISVDEVMDCFLRLREHAPVKNRIA